MIRIPTSRNLFALVSEEDAGLARSFKWTAKPTGRKSGCFYAFSTVSGKTVYLHRLIMNPEPGLHVDHINGDGLDNRRENLRVCTQSQNLACRPHPANKFGFRGVTSWGVGSREQFRAHVGSGETRQKGPWRKTPEDAARDYDEIALRMYGEFARLNFPGEK
jgi:hypothetical protein